MDAVNKENAPKTGRKHRILAVILPLAAFVLELLPLGAALRFGHMQTETGSVIYRLQGYSYFDLMLPGYGNFGPFIAGLLTTLTLIFAGIYALSERKWLLHVCAVRRCGCGVAHAFVFKRGAVQRDKLCRNGAFGRACVLRGCSGGIHAQA